MGERTMIDLSESVKELSFEDTAIKFKQKNGKWRVSLRQLSEYYDVPFHQASRKITQNKEIFRDLEDSVRTASSNGSVIDYDLTIRDAFSYLSLVSYKRYDDERKNYLIRLRNWLIDNAEKVLTGELVLKADFETMIDLGSLKDDPKSIQGDNGLRRALFVKKVREAHPTGPNTRVRLIDLAHNDQNLVRGPHVPFEAGAHKKYDKELALKDSAQKMVSFAAIACGKIEIGDINRFEKEIFRGLPEKYIPEYLPGLIESTTQTRLLE